MHAIQSVFPEPSQTFISQDANFTEEWGGTRHQQNWGRLCWLAVQEGLAFLQKANINFQSFYDAMAMERWKIAVYLNQENAHGEHLYGIPRMENNHRVGSFSAERPRCKIVFDSIIIPSLLKIPEKETADEGYYTLESDFTYKSYIIESSDQTHVYAEIKHYYEKNTISYIYATTAASEHLMAKAAEIFQELLTLPTDAAEDDKLLKLGQLMWHLALACPLKNGSAAVAELVYHALRLHLNLPLAPLTGTEFIAWDIKALFTASAEEYADWFQSQYQLARETELHAIGSHINGVDTIAITLESQAQTFLTSLRATPFLGLPEDFQFDVRKDKYGLVIADYCLRYIKEEGDDSLIAYAADNSGKLLFDFSTQPLRVELLNSLETTAQPDEVQSPPKIFLIPILPGFLSFLHNKKLAGLDTSSETIAAKEKIEGLWYAIKQLLHEPYEDVKPICNLLFFQRLLQPITLTDSHTNALKDKLSNFLSEPENAINFIEEITEDEALALVNALQTYANTIVNHNLPAILKEQPYVFLLLRTDSADSFSTEDHRNFVEYLVTTLPESFWTEELPHPYRDHSGISVIDLIKHFKLETLQVALTTKYPSLTTHFSPKPSNISANPTTSGNVSP